MKLSDHEYDVLADRAFANGKAYAATHGYSDSPLSGEYAGDPTPFSVIVELDLDPYDIDPDDEVGLCDHWIDGYELHWDEQDNGTDLPVTE